MLNIPNEGFLEDWHEIRYNNALIWLFTLKRRNIRYKNAVNWDAAEMNAM
ncbi:hypothetical protein ACFRAM_26875 [Paenibacillus sp. NPDC056722]